MTNKHMKRCSTLLIIREMQIKLQWDITSHQSEWPSSKIHKQFWRECGEKGTLLHCGNVNWYSHYGEQYGGSLKTELPYDPVILLLGIYLEKNIIQKEACTPAFITALFTIAKIWKLSKCPPTEECIKMLYICTVEYYSAIIKNETMPFVATWVDL